MRKLSSVAAITALTAALLTGCGDSDDQAEDGAVELRVAWSGSDERNRRTQEALDLYMERNPHLSITVEYTSTTDFWDRLTTQVAAREAPDIVQMSGQTLAQYATNDVLYDMAEFTPDPIDVADWEEEPLAAQTFDGTLYGIPPALDGHALVYDATKFEELGLEPPSETWTWSEFADLARAVKTAAGDDYYGTEDGGAQYEVLQSFLLQRGRELFDEDGRPGFERQDIVDLWTFWAELRDEGVAVPANVQTEYGTSPENSGVIQGFAAMDFAVSSLYTNYVALTQRDVGITTYPFGDDGTPGQVWRAGFSWSITRGSDHPEEAARLIDFLVNDPDAGELLLTSRGVPASPAIREEVRAVVDEADQASFDYLETLQAHDATINPLMPTGFPDFRDLYERLYYEVAFDRMTIDEGADELLRQAEQLLG